jgi:hypothetical protein
MAKTLFLYEVLPDESFFFELEGDYSHLQGVYINAVHPKDTTREKWEALQDELSNLIYRTSEEAKAIEKANPKASTHEIYQKNQKIDKPTKDWDYFVKCGFIL